MGAREQALTIIDAGSDLAMHAALGMSPARPGQAAEGAARCAGAVGETPRKEPTCPRSFQVRGHRRISGH
jgi:hypothetical protein